MISKLKDRNGKIKIPGFYKDVVNSQKRKEIILKDCLFQKYNTQKLLV